MKRFCNGIEPQDIFIKQGGCLEIINRHGYMIDGCPGLLLRMHHCSGEREHDAKQTGQGQQIHFRFHLKIGCCSI